MTELITSSVVSLIVGGGIATILTLKSKKREASANADQAEVQARAEEFHLLKEQIELNQQQNLDLTKLNLELVAQNKDNEKRHIEQTELLRKVQRDLIKAEQNIVALTKENGDLRVELAEKKCEDKSCPFRLPPNAFTPPLPGESKESYIKKTRAKKQPAKKETTKI